LNSINESSTHRFGVAIVSMRDGLTGGLRTPLLALPGALGMVMLLVCVNIANLQMVKLEARRRELAARGALGASRGWLIRHARGARGSGRGRRCAAATRRNPDVTTSGECERARSSALNLGEASAAASPRWSEVAEVDRGRAVSAGKLKGPTRT